MELKEFIQNNGSAENKQLEDQINLQVSTFRQNVKDLYTSIKVILEELVNEGFVKLKEGRMNICEDRLGTYSISTLTITVLSQSIELKPVGTNMIGTIGRVDMFYRGIRRIMLVLVGENITSAEQLIEIRINGEATRQKKDPGNLVWKIVNTLNRNTLEFLNKENLEGVIMFLLNGKE